jgi:hypothetical protein
MSASGTKKTFEPCPTPEQGFSFHALLLAVVLIGFFSVPFAQAIRYLSTYCWLFMRWGKH